MQPSFSDARLVLTHSMHSEHFSVGDNWPHPVNRCRIREIEAENQGEDMMAHTLSSQALAGERTHINFVHANMTRDREQN